MKRERVNNIISYGTGVISLVGVYLLTRLVNLTIIPIFTDEAIYLRWGQIALGDPRWRFISLIDGKQPLLIWLFLPVLKLISDPLVAGRLVSVGAGLFGMIGLGLLVWTFTRSVRGFIIGGLLYILVPFFLMYDRLAVYDALLCAICIWALLLSYWFARKLQLGIALILGSVIGAGLLTKTSANFYLILLPATLLVIPWEKRGKSRQFITWVGLVLAVIVQSQIYNSVLRLSEFRHIIGQKNLSFIYSFSEFLHGPFKVVYGNSIGLTSWLVSYLTIPLIILIVIAMIWFVGKNWRQGLFLLAYFLIPFAALAFFGKVIYPRFILFMVPPLLVPLGIFLAEHLKQNQKNAIVLSVVMAAVLLPLLYFNMTILFDPIHAPMPGADRQQLINDWPAGYGIKEAVSYLQQEAKTGSIIVGTEGTFGLYPMALELYLGKDPNVTFKPYWPLNEFPDELQILAREKPTFLLFKERQQIPPEWPLQMIKEYQRGDGPTYLKFYRVLPKQ